MIEKLRFGVGYWDDEIIHCFEDSNGEYKKEGIVVSQETLGKIFKKLNEVIDEVNKLSK